MWKPTIRKAKEFCHFDGDLKKGSIGLQTENAREFYGGVNVIKKESECVEVLYWSCPYHEDVVERYHMKGWKGALVKASLSNLARKRLAYEGDILVPIAVPCICK